MLVLCTIFILQWSIHGQDSNTIVNDRKSNNTNTIDLPCEAGDCVYYYDNKPPIKAGESFSTGCRIPLGCNVDITISIQLKNNRPLDTWEVTFGCFGIIYVNALKQGYNSVFYYSKRNIPPAREIEHSGCDIKIKNTNLFFSQEYVGNYVIKSYEGMIQSDTNVTIAQEYKKNNGIIFAYTFISISVIVAVLLILLFYRRIKPCITHTLIK